MASREVLSLGGMRVQTEPAEEWIFHSLVFLRQSIPAALTIELCPASL